MTIPIAHVGPVAGPVGPIAHVGRVAGPVGQVAARVAAQLAGSIDPTSTLPR